MSDEYPRLSIESIEQWHDWLQAHHGQRSGIWLVTFKKGHESYVAYSDVVDEALAFGWVDSVPRSLDSSRTQRLVTPRRPGSNWSRVNKERIERLDAAGRLHHAGREVVDAAKEDGSWTALDEVEKLTVPSDLRAALDQEESAQAHWARFPRSTQRAILEWINSAKTETTRQRRIEKTVLEAAAGRRANQWRQVKGQ